MNRTQIKIAHREGMILLLVVAVLVLLALMGTVYILTASTDKQVSYATNDQANLGYATQGALSIVRADILNTTLGPSNSPLALGSQTPARVWTGPDLGYMSNGMIGTPMEDPNSAGTAPSGSQPQIASQPWLCGLMPYEPNTTYQLGTTTVPAVNPGSTVPYVQVYGTSGTLATRPFGAYEPLISVLTPALYDPADGAYDISYYGMNLNPSQTAGAGGVVPIPNAAVVMPAYRYDPAMASTAATTGEPPMEPFGTRDAMWNMLPYSSPNGTHYRFAVRIMDTSAMMNVNTGWIANATNPSQSPNNQSYSSVYPATGAAMASYPIYYLPGTFNPSDASSGMQAANLTIPPPPTRAGTYVPSTGTYGLLNWQQELAYYENQGVPNANNEYLNLYGPGTELQWLAYGGAGGQFGLLATNRLGAQMQNTFGTSLYGTGYQSFYTTYSWSRQYASANPGTTVSSLSPAGGPLYPSRVNLNAAISPTNGTQIGTLASQIAGALQACQYDPTHSYAWALNYLDYRFPSAKPATLTGTSLTYYNGSTAVTATLTGTGVGNEAMVANSNQPYLNELEATISNTSGTPSVKAYGVELYNPYSTAIAVGGWQLQFFNSALGSEGTYTIPAGTSVPANGYIVIDNGSPPLTGSPTVLSSSVPASALSASATYAALEAPFPGAPALSGVPADFCVVDATGYKTAGTPPNGTSYLDVSRSDAGSGYALGCANSVAGLVPVTPSNTSTGVTLGAANTQSNGSTAAPYLPLYNRDGGDPIGSFAPTAANNYQILNWADANCIARECSIDTSSGFDPITWQLGAGTISSTVSTNVPKDSTTVGSYTAMTDEQQLAQLYFDFPFDPRAALTAADMPTSGAVEPNVLTMFSLNARADDPSVTPVGVAYANLLTRTPGLLNVNTAGEVPLYDAIYDGAVGALGATKGPLIASQLAADTIAYRNRLAQQSSFPAFTDNGGTPQVSASGNTPAYTTIPGYNIKSLGDLLYAWLQEPLYEKDVGATPTSFLQRDALWAACANNFCVHSDTFAVYGLIQAIRLNPNYVSSLGKFHRTDWYNANQLIYGSSGTVEGMLSPQSSITTSSGTAIPEFILEGQRRFVAIVDSSYSTPSTTGGSVPAPKIVAIKYLPQ